MNTTWLPSIDSGAGPKHQAIKQSIRAAIADGTIRAGHRLPPVREVAWRLGVTPGTVARAYKDLVDDGALDAQVGRGTFVAEPGSVSPAVEETPYLVYAPAQGEVNMRAAQVADVGQGAVFHRLLAALPPPAPGAYASYPTAGHDARLRALLAAWFSGPDHGELSPEDMVLTLGAQHALVVLLTATLHGPRPVIATEELAYPGIRHAAALLRAGMIGLPFDDEGVMPDALDRACIEHGLQLFVTSAEAHNPTTIRTSPARRAAIVEVARHHGLQIVDDDCFGFGATAEPSYRLLAPERTWVISSLSKTVSPDIRVGAIIAPGGRSIVVRSAAQQQYFGLPRPVVDLVTLALETGEAAAIAARVKDAAARRIAATRAALGRASGLRLRDGVPFAWLPMPRGWRASSFLRAAEAEGIRLKAADEFALIDGRAPNAVRLALTGERDDARFAQALDTLVRLLSSPPLEVDV
jgi:DNA-binding transcriptional MocR family regulator